MSKVFCIPCINNFEFRLILHRWSKAKCYQCHKKGQNLLVTLDAPLTKEAPPMGIEIDLWNEQWKLDPRPKQKCPNCNRLWPDPSQFCGFCGLRLEKLQPMLDCKGIIHKTNESVVGKADSH